MSVPPTETCDLFRAIVEHSHDAVAVSHADGRMIYVNPAHEALFGFHLDDMKAMTVRDFHPPESRATLEGEIARAIAEGGTWEGVIDAVDAQARRFPVWQRWDSIRDDAGRLLCCLTRTHDATRQMEREAAQRRNDELLECLYDGIDVCLWINEVRPDGEIVFIHNNPADRRVTGCDLRSNDGIPLEAVIPPELVDKHRERCREIVRRNAPASFEDISCVDGRERWMRNTLIPVRDATGRVYRILGSGIDVTNWRQAQKALQEANERLEARVAERTAELARANEQLRAEMAERRRMEALARKRQEDLARAARLHTMAETASFLAHELSQPISALATYTQGCLSRLKARGESADPILLAGIERASAQATRASQVVQRIRTLIRGRQPRLCPTDLNDLVREIADLVHRDAEAGSITLRLDLDDDLPAVPLDSIGIGQIVLNLVRNALEAVREHAGRRREVTVRTSLGPDDTVHLAVSDTGIGFSPQDAEKIFTQFFTTKHDGLGIGLSIVKRIAEAHGGRVWARSEPGRGATFHLSLPIVRGGVRE